MKVKIVLFLFLFISLTSAGAGEAQLHFKWALLIREVGSEAIKTSDENIVPISREKEFCFFYQPIKTGYFYIYHYSSDNEITCLENEPPGKETLPQFYPNKNKNVDEWYYLGSKPGLDTFFILVDKNPLKDLDRIYRRYRKAVDKNKDPGKLRDELIKKLYHYADNSKQENTKIQSVPIMGVVKGTEDLKVLEIKAEKTYGRIIKISH